MARKNDMVRLLQLIDQGAGQGVIEAAQACWQELPESQRAELKRCGRLADCQRARLWAAAWDGASQVARQRLEHRVDS